MSLSDAEAMKKLSVPIPVVEKPGKGGKIERYVPVGKVIERLNEVWGLDWELKIDDYIFRDGEVGALVSITYPTENGRRTKKAFGGKTKNSAIGFGNKAKASVYLAITKAESLIGVVGNYEDEEETLATMEQIEELVDLLKLAKAKTIPSIEELKKYTMADIKAFIAATKERINKN
jgi:hypothetical protein